MTWRHMVMAALAVGVGGAWLIGRFLGALGLRHSGGHFIAEVAALATLTLVALMLGRAGRPGGAP